MTDLSLQSLLALLLFIGVVKVIVASMPMFVTVIALNLVSAAVEATAVAVIQGFRTRQKSQPS